MDVVKAEVKRLYLRVAELSTQLDNCRLEGTQHLQKPSQIPSEVHCGHMNDFNRRDEQINQILEALDENKAQGAQILELMQSQAHFESPKLQRYSPRGGVSKHTRKARKSQRSSLVKSQTQPSSKAQKAKHTATASFRNKRADIPEPKRRSERLFLKKGGAV